MASNRIKTLFQRYPLLRNISVMMSGTVIAQLLTFALQPIISRVYTPAEIGMLGVFLTIPQVVAVIAGMRYEYALILPKRDVDARQIALLCLRIAIVMAVALTLIGFVFGGPIARALGQPNLENWMPLLGLESLFLYLPTLLNYWLTRKMAFRTLSSNRILTVVATFSTRIAGPFVSLGGMWGLMISQLFGQAVSISNMARVAKKLGYEKSGSEAAGKANSEAVSETSAPTDKRNETAAAETAAEEVIAAANTVAGDTKASGSDLELIIDPIVAEEATQPAGAMEDNPVELLHVKDETADAQADAQTDVAQQAADAQADAQAAPARSKRFLAWKYRSMPLLNMPNALVDALRINGLVAIIGVFFGQTIVGQFVQAWNLVQAATMFILASLQQVFFQKISSAKPGEMTRIVTVSIGITAALAIPGFALLALISPWLIPLYLGKQWYTAGLVTQALCPWLAVSVIYMPIATVFIPADKQHYQLFFGIIYAVAPIIAVILCVQAGMSIVQFAWIMSWLQAAVLAVMVLVTLWVAKKYDARAHS